MGNETSKTKQSVPNASSFHSTRDLPRSKTTLLPSSNSKPEQKEEEAEHIPTTALIRPESHDEAISRRWRKEFEKCIKVTAKCNIIEHIGVFFSYKKRLAKGSSCRVLLCESTTTKRLYALKEMSKYSKYNPTLYLTERKILTNLKSHPNVVTYFDSFIDNKCLYIVSEYCGGGTLLDKIIQMNTFTENIAAKYITTMLQVVQFIHEQKIAHRDLKPNNIVFDKPGDGGILKLIDFGDALIIEDDAEDGIFVGTLHYFTPEMIQSRYRKGWQIRKGDVYCIGVIAYVLLTGVFPFYGKSQKQVKRAITKGEIHWPKHVKLTENCKDFILQLLNQDIEKRLSAKQALSHKWLTGDAPHDDLGDGLKAYQNNFNHSNMLQRLLIDAIFSEMSADEKRLIVNELQKHKGKRKEAKTSAISAPNALHYSRTDSIISEQEFVEFMIANHVDENTAKTQTDKLFKQVSHHEHSTFKSVNVGELLQQIEDEIDVVFTPTEELEEIKEDEDDGFDILGSLSPKQSGTSKGTKGAKSVKMLKAASVKCVESKKLKLRYEPNMRAATLRAEDCRSIQIINMGSILHVQVSKEVSQLTAHTSSSMNSFHGLSLDELQQAIAFGRSPTESVYNTEIKFEHPSITVDQFRSLLAKAPQKLDIESVIDDLDPNHTGIIDLVNVTNYTREVKIIE